MTKRFFFVAFCLCAFIGGILFPSIVFADSEKSLALKKQIEQTVSFYSNIYSSGGVIDIVWDGEVLVEPVEDYFAVTLPDLKIVDKIKKQEIHVGMIAANVVPVPAKNEEDPEKWSMSIAVPTPIFTYEKNQIVGQFNTGEQHISLLWIPSWKQILDADIALNAVELYDYNGTSNTFVDLFTFKRVFQKDKEKNTWSGYDRYSVESLQRLDKNKDPQLKIKKLVGRTDLQNLDLQKIAELQGSFSEFSKWSADNRTTINSLSIFDLIGQSLGLYDSQKTMIHAEGLYFEDRDLGRRFEIKTIDSLIEGRRADVAFMRSKFWVEDLMISSFDENGGEHISAHSPVQLSFDVALTGLPSVEEIKGVLEQETSQKPIGNSMQDVVKINTQQLLSLLHHKGTKLTIADAKIDTALSGFNLAGHLSFHPEASWGIESIFTILTRGLDRLSQSIAFEMGGEMGDEMGGKAGAMILPMIQSLGQVVPKSEGEALDVSETRSYKIEINKDGTVLFNGTNIAPLLSLVQPMVEKRLQQSE